MRTIRSKFTCHVLHLAGSGGIRGHTSPACRRRGTAKQPPTSRVRTVRTIVALTPGAVTSRLVCCNSTSCYILTRSAFAGVPGLYQTASLQLLSAMSWCTQISRQVVADSCTMHQSAAMCSARRSRCCDLRWDVNRGAEAGTREEADGCIVEACATARAQQLWRIPAAEAGAVYVSKVSSWRRSRITVTM